MKKLSKMKYLFTIVLSLQLFSGLGQLRLIPIQPKKTSNSYSSQRNLNSSESLSLPFWDDFSWSNHTPDSLWMEGSDVYINSTTAINPPTLNVATFDGLNGQGQPHSTTISSTPIVADQLTSRLIDLSNFSTGDNVALSFYYQKKGFGYEATSTETLSLYFSDSTSQDGWTLIEEFAASEVQDTSNFAYFSTHINEGKYLHDGFQFKLENTGNGAGPFDAWHVDYIYLNAQRTDINSDLVIEDQAISTHITSPIAPYTQVPKSMWNVLNDGDFKEMTFQMSNLSRANVVIEFEFEFTIFQLNAVGESINKEIVYPTQTFTPSLLSGSIAEERTIPALTKNDFESITALDSVVLQSELVFTGNDGTNYFLPDGLGDSLRSESYNLKLNDTSRVNFTLHNSLAYDDGSAEIAGGGRGYNTKVAIEFDIPVSEHVTGVDIHFPNILTSQGVGSQSFSLYISEDLSVDEDTILTSGAFFSGVSDINSFQRFEFDSSANVAGRFYVIIEQKADEYLSLGLDQNTNTMDRVKYNIGEDWIDATTEIPFGSFMVRPVFGEETTPPAQEVVNEVSISPNPTSGQLNIFGEFQEYTIVNLSGSVVKTGNESRIDLSEVDNGIYFIIVDSKEGNTSSRLIVKH